MDNNANLKRSERRKQKDKTKKKSVAKNIIKFVIYTFIILIFAAAGVIGAKVWTIIKDTPEISEEALTKQAQSSIVYADNGEEVATLFGASNRIWVPLDQIPKDLQNAFVAIEDQRFYQNNLGIDPKRIIGALIANIKAGGKPVEGASTITQQLVKNTMLSSEKTLSRKIKEAILAWRLEQKYSKEQILEAYLNTIYLGGPNVNAYGVEAAARAYFNKHVNELDLAESALIAGITKNPSLYSPAANKEAAIERQRLVLKEMLKQGYITQEQYDEAINEKLEFDIHYSVVSDKHKYFIDQVKEDVANALSQKLNISYEEAMNKIFNGGLRIYTTMDVNIQNIMEEAFKNSKLFPADLKDKEGNIRIVQGAMVVMDWRTGEVKGIVGRRETDETQGKVRVFNYATTGGRPPGSSIKPITVYGPALEKGYTAATVVDDVPVYYKQWNWEPHNYSRNTYKGLMTFREALKVSQNIPAVRIVVEMIGLNTAAEYGKKFGLDITERIEKSPAALSLGAGGEVTPLQMAAAYGAIANGGVYTSPITFTKVTDSEGNVILENKPSQHIVLSPQNAYILTNMMQEVVKPGGTGTNARLPNMPVAGKTGTNENYYDAWFAGFTPYYSASVWMGTGENIAMIYGGKGVTGGSYPAIFWKTVMMQIHKNLPYKDFVRPPGIISVTVCRDSGELPTDLCHLDPRGDRTYTEIFAQGTQPTTYCTVHVTAKINSQNGKLATDLTPPDLVKDAVFIDPPGRTPAQNAVALDGKYVVPKEYDDTVPPPQNSDNGDAPGDNTQPPPANNGGTEQPPGGETTNPPPNNGNSQTSPPSNNPPSTTNPIP
ncbi:MAG: Penicillin-binding protein, 1A family [Caldanaerobacter subterraneus]|jgi:penicillin-binding protein 1A|uniref:Penicillin-binding protein 1A n=2 Tax=Thermoanaerobacter TaxID=1754 RepID=B0KD85_THEP3|nr:MULTISPECIES: PBP1A family penicillin-binding protein [Thermoanaerobacter]KUJ90026.1 MAG: penicillin-binding protein, 1A family [Thermoanaerobacter thermocopriae]KUK34707.1 MAG: Penicillin-binding protein, 1A family [Caldanaerobacter subterraneus]ABY91560.1 penicillin-binding protein, 1A family [Thermoanaerobacter sp. X514]ABY95604.1 penicillin-binding protein, 1A family [Thermoanaerobacter pseudethanolicus ATCC 33223]ADV80542.1 penicillin-binding protein, 1A family [Thermoanaerobacter broc